MDDGFQNPTIHKDFSIDKDIKISINGIPKIKSIDLLETFKDLFVQSYLSLNIDQKSSDSIISALTTKIIRKIIKDEIGKKPEVKTHIIRL